MQAYPCVIVILVSLSQFRVTITRYDNRAEKMNNMVGLSYVGLCGFKIMKGGKGCGAG